MTGITISNGQTGCHFVNARQAVDQLAHHHHHTTILFWVLGFICVSLLSIFNKAVVEVTSGDSALWEATMEKNGGRKGRKKVPSHSYLSLSAMNNA